MLSLKYGQRNGPIVVTTTGQLLHNRDIPGDEADAKSLERK